MIRLKYNSFDTNMGIQKANRKTEILFLLSILLTHIWLQSDSVDLEQATTHYDCFKKVSVQFLTTDTNWKGGTLVQVTCTSLEVRLVRN